MERKQTFPENSSEKEACSMAENPAGAIRRRHKERRNAMDAEQVASLSRCICRKVLESEVYETSSTIYGYYPLGNEVDCLAVLRQALLDGKTVALPKTEQDCRMEFYRITSMEQVAEGCFHVMEPLAGCPLMQEREALVLVPGVVFDRSGARYGYGRGYYDRYFARFPGLYRMALAYGHQIEETLPVQETDVPVNLVITERNLYQGKPAGN